MERFRLNKSVSNLPLDYSTGTMGAERKLVAFYVHASASPTTNENFVITLDSHLGSDYDAVLYALDLAAGPTPDIASLDFNAPLHPDDGLKVTYTNTDKVTLSVELVLE